METSAAEAAQAAANVAESPGLAPARWPRSGSIATKLLRIDPDGGTYDDALLSDLPGFLSPDDLLVVNDAATLPASLSGRTKEGRMVEVRLAGAIEGERETGTNTRIDGRRGRQGPQRPQGLATPHAVWLAALLGEGDWRWRTEERPAPPVLEQGAILRFDEGMTARVDAISALSPRLVTLRFDRSGASFWAALYRAGRPIQYSYLDGPLALWHVQTPYAARPAAVEPASAGLALTWGLLTALRSKGVRLARLTHAAGLSSTGDPAIDAALPLPEWFEVPEPTVRAISEAREKGARVVAIGTSVVRALEGCAAHHGGRLESGSGTTDLRIGAGYRPAIVDGLLTGMHEPGTTHFAMLEAFAPRELLDRAHAHAAATGALGHEFGDACLILGSSPAMEGRSGTLTLASVVERPAVPHQAIADSVRCHQRSTWS